MKKMNLTGIFVMLLIALVVVSCVEQKEQKVKEVVEENTFVTKTNDAEACLGLMQTHLDAVTNRDLETLTATLSPRGNMQLILSGTEITEGVEGFIAYHKDWFALPDWTFETNILNADVGPELGMAIVEVIYREPLRDGKPYFNRMIVSYVLQKVDGQWYVIKDHASSVEKSTDKNS